ncbi:hypothetical protein HDK77DRAFT_497232 [Phyllosticta capitalensis]
MPPSNGVKPSAVKNATSPPPIPQRRDLPPSETVEEGVHLNPESSDTDSESDVDDSAIDLSADSPTIENGPNEAQELDWREGTLVDLDGNLRTSYLLTRSKKRQAAIFADLGTIETLQARFPNVTDAQLAANISAFHSIWKETIDAVTALCELYRETGVRAGVASFFTAMQLQAHMETFVKQTLGWIPLDVQFIIGSPGWKVQNLKKANPTSTTSAGVYVDLLQAKNETKAYTGSTKCFASRWGLYEDVVRNRKAYSKTSEHEKALATGKFRGDKAGIERKTEKINATSTRSASVYVDILKSKATVNSLKKHRLQTDDVLMSIS